MMSSSKKWNGSERGWLTRWARARTMRNKWTSLKTWRA
jgi:hypothetical protein